MPPRSLTPVGLEQTLHKAITISEQSQQPKSIARLHLDMRHANQTISPQTQTKEASLHTGHTGHTGAGRPDKLQPKSDPLKKSGSHT